MSNSSDIYKDKANDVLWNLYVNLEMMLHTYKNEAVEIVHKQAHISLVFSDWTFAAWVRSGIWPFFFFFFEEGHTALGSKWSKSNIFIHRVGLQKQKPTFIKGIKLKSGG